MSDTLGFILFILPTIIGCIIAVYVSNKYLVPLYARYRRKRDKERVEMDYMADKYYNDLYNEVALDDLNRQMNSTKHQMSER